MKFRQKQGDNKMQTLQSWSGYSYESISEEVVNRFRRRVNNATATATVLAEYSKRVVDRDSFNVSLLAMVVDGIADMLTTAISEYEDNIEREEVR